MNDKGVGYCSGKIYNVSEKVEFFNVCFVFVFFISENDFGNRKEKDY